MTITTKMINKGDYYVFDIYRYNFFAIIIMAFCTPPSDNKDTTKKEKTENDDFEDFIIFNMINKHK